MNDTLPVVSVVIPTFNRFKYLMNTIDSIRAQNYPNKEIIVVNDRSTEPEYYTHDFGSDVKVIHLDVNSKQKFGYASCGHVRNHGIAIASGTYVAFCDDDDIWLNNKLEMQIKAMKETGCRLSSTDGVGSQGVFYPNKKCIIFNQGRIGFFQQLFRNKGSNLLDTGFPTIWNREFMKVHNLMIVSSVVIEKDLLTQINNFKDIKTGEEDYDCWMRALEHTDSVYLKGIYFHYDLGHGDGKQY